MSAVAEETVAPVSGVEADCAAQGDSPMEAPMAAQPEAAEVEVQPANPEAPEHSSVGVTAAAVDWQTAVLQKIARGEVPIVDAARGPKSITDAAKEWGSDCVVPSPTKRLQTARLPANSPRSPVVAGRRLKCSGDIRGPRSAR